MSSLDKRFDAMARRKYGISGDELLDKTEKGESGGRKDAVSSVGARGWMQFMPGTRDAVRKRYGIDPWRSRAEAREAAKRHMVGDLGNAEGLEGYNPGGGQKYVKYILGQKVGSGPAPATVDSTIERRVSSAPPPGQPDTRVEDAILDTFLHQGRRKGSLFGAVTHALDMMPAPAPQTVESTREPSMAGGSGGDYEARANAIDKKHLPYLWGGGHGGKVNPYAAAPLDCSGAVSAVLGISPKVAADFMKWGEAGEGKKLTVYAKGTHVLVKINGHFWGTSASNPGGGAGWIDSKHISPAYLKGFTVRHPPGQ